MSKTLEKVSKNPETQNAARKGSEKYINQLKESTLNDVQKAVKIHAIQAMVALILPLARLPLPTMPL